MNVEVDKYDITGRKINTIFSGLKAGGKHTILYNADNLASGVYLYRIKADDFVSIKRMTLLK